MLIFYLACTNMCWQQFYDALWHCNITFSENTDTETLIGACQNCFEGKVQNCNHVIHIIDNLSLVPTWVSYLALQNGNLDSSLWKPKCSKCEVVICSKPAMEYLAIAVTLLLVQKVSEGVMYSCYQKNLKLVCSFHSVVLYLCDLTIQFH